jgi:tRNA CCA-adding enzyme
MEIKKVLRKKIAEIIPREEEMGEIREETREIMEKIGKAARSMKIGAEVFLGGSLAKGTIIKNDRYDIDIFIRFEKDEGISDKLERILKKAGLKYERVHGSRDYFRLGRDSLFEIIPTLKIKKPENAKNVTDLSYFHVSYVLGCIKKNRKLGDEIILAKAFCYAQKCYGAESYIKGFSGYALELLICHYKSFLRFIKVISEAREQIVLDPGKHYRNRQEILINLNEAKLQSPIVFVDPTFKERNALAALSVGTFKKFQENCIKFMKKPSEKFFQQEKINEKNYNFIVETRTGKQEGDIAGSKLIKFFGFMSRNLEKYCLINRKDFEYDNKKTGKNYFNIKIKKEIILQGPPINKPENLLRFREKHKNVFIKGDKSFAREKVNLSLGKFVEDIKKSGISKEMGITDLKILKNN